MLAVEFAKINAFKTEHPCFLVKRFRYLFLQKHGQTFTTVSTCADTPGGLSSKTRTKPPGPSPPNSSVKSMKLSTCSAKLANGKTDQRKIFLISLTRMEHVAPPSSGVRIISFWRGWDTEKKEEENMQGGKEERKQHNLKEVLTRNQF